MPGGMERQHHEEQRFGKFILRKRLGAGGMAEVFLAEMVGPEGFGKLVALKRILPSLSDDEAFIDSFISEARLGGSLNHPNIVQTLELGKEGEHYYLAMEYVQGITLANLLQHRKRIGAPLPLSVVLDIARQICDGLAYAHAATDPRGNPLHMVHRDLKPDNILLSLFGVVKITDFGVAKATSNLHKTVDHMVKGTVAYMSPEQAESRPLDHRSDLYSLGSILFEMLTLELLYPDANGLPGLVLVQKGEVAERLKRLSSYPKRLVDLVTHMLAPDRNARCASASAIKREITAIAATVPTSLLDLSDIIKEVIAHRNATRAREPFAEPLGSPPAGPGAGPVATLATPEAAEALRQSVPLGDQDDAIEQPTVPSSPSLARRASEASSGRVPRPDDLSAEPTPEPVPPSPPLVASHPSQPSFSGTGRPPGAKTPGDGEAILVESLWHAEPTSLGSSSQDILPRPEPVDEDTQTELVATPHARREPSAGTRPGRRPFGERTRLVPHAKGTEGKPAHVMADVFTRLLPRKPVHRSRRLVIGVTTGIVVLMIAVVVLLRVTSSEQAATTVRQAAMTSAVATAMPAQQDTQTRAPPDPPSATAPAGPSSPRPQRRAAGRKTASATRPGKTHPVAVGTPVRTPAAGQAGPVTSARPAKPAPRGSAAQPAGTRNATAGPAEALPENREKPGGSKPRGSGYLSVNASPWAYVYLDGKKLETTTPLDDFELPAGKHTLTFKTEEGKTRGPIHVTIRAGEHKVMTPVIFE